MSHKKSANINVGRVLFFSALGTALLILPVAMGMPLLATSVAIIPAALFI